MIIKKVFSRKTIDRLFEIVISIKSFFGFFEVIAGAVVAVSNRFVADNFIITLMQQEVLSDPDDPIANFIINAANNFSAGSHIFAAIYLIFHGTVNIFLAVALFKNKLWAYPCAIAGFGLFIFYQFFRYFHNFSPVLLAFTIFDIFLVLIVFLEYKKKLKNSNRII
jgi:uncharacterized membrane protein